MVGGGAIGGITAALADADVVVLDANEAHAAKLNDPGLVINDGAPVKVEAVTSVDQLEGEFDFALIAVKSPLHEVVIPPLVERGEIEAFVTLGNGLIQDRIEAMVGEGNLLACLVEWGGSNVGPGELIRDSEGGYVVGELDGMLTERARRLGEGAQADRHHAHHRQRARDDLDQAQVNSTFTGLSAVSGLRYGGVAEQGPEAVYALWEEGVQVARAQGLELGEMHDVHAYEFGPEGLAQMMRHMANVRPSMLQDLDAGRETEVDVVNGGVASKGRELGIPTPHNDARRRARALDGARRARSRPEVAATTSATAQITSATETESRPSPTRPDASARPRSSGRRACPGSAGRGRGSPTACVATPTSPNTPASSRPSQPAPVK